MSTQWRVRGEIVIEGGWRDDLVAEAVDELGDRLRSVGGECSFAAGMLSFVLPLREQYSVGDAHNETVNQIDRTLGDLGLPDGLYRWTSVQPEPVL